MKRYKTRIFSYIIPGIILFWIIPVFYAGAAPGNMKKITPSASGLDIVQTASDQPSNWKGRLKSGIRSRQIGINPRLIKKGGIVEGQDINLQLFDDLKVTATIRHTATNKTGTGFATAHLKDSRWGRVFLASTNGQVKAKILWPEKGKILSIEYNPEDGNHYSLELDPKLAEFDDSDVPHPSPPPVTGNIQPSALNDSLKTDIIAQADESTDATSVIDVMVVYSNDALAAAGSESAVNNQIALGMAFANDAHENTGTGIYLNLVHSQLVNYDGTNNQLTDLQNLQGDSDNFMDDVHALRDTHGADFVVLMVGDYSSDGGIAYVINISSGYASYAFSVVTEPAFDSYTPGHEIGHNMGLSHAKDQTVQPGPTAWQVDGHNFGTTTAGWHWHTDTTPGIYGYCSVMTYTWGGYFADGLDHIRVGLFSDPDIDYAGLPSGDAMDGNSAVVLRELKTVYEGYRDRSVPANSILVDTPNGGETLSTGDTYKIFWDSNGVTGNVKIELLKNGIPAKLIDADTLNDRLYSWTVPEGISGYNYTIRVSNLDATISDTSDTVFTIKEVFYNEAMDTDPGYSSSGGWEFGAPSGNQVQYGGPGIAASGTNIYDTDLDFVYTATGYLTSTAVNCSGFENVQLSFMGWFSINTGYEATIEVSNDNATWHEVYSWRGVFLSSQWQEYSFDISSYADGRPAVYIRWGHVDVSGSGNYAGMSVDDVKLTGINPSAGSSPNTLIPIAIFNLLLGQ